MRFPHPLVGPQYKTELECCKTNMVPHMPTAPQNLKKYFLVDADFWADNGTEIGEKWETLKAGF